MVNRKIKQVSCAPSRFAMNDCDWRKNRVARPDGWPYSRVLMSNPDIESDSDYQRAVRALEFLEANFRDSPTLAQTAAAVGLSPYHFQRLFKRWVGLSPKKFLQALALNHAQQQLRQGSSTLSCALDSGLSGPGRLHDLFVTFQSATPAQYRDYGKGLTIYYGTHSSPFGECLIGLSDRGLCWLSFGPTGQDDIPSDLRNTWKGADFKESQKLTRPLARRIFPGGGALPQEPIPVLVRGTEFQLQVWRGLLGVPLGTTISYAGLSRKIRRERAVRAVGSAVGQNPISFLIPCHRVILSGGATGQYRWGSARKRLMLQWEKLSLLESPANL